MGVEYSLEYIKKSSIYVYTNCIIYNLSNKKLLYNKLLEHFYYAKMYLKLHYCKINSRF